MMTTEELRLLVAKSPNVDWFNSREVDINYKTIGFQTKLVGVTSIYQFLSEQITGLDNLQKPLPRQFDMLLKEWIAIKQEIVELVKREIASDYDWNNRVRNSIAADSPKFLYNSPETMFLLEVHKNHPKNYPAAYQYITSSNDLTNAGSKDYFTGYLMAYDLRYKNKPVPNSANSAEVVKIYEEYISKCETNLVQFLNESQKKTTDSINTIDDLILTKRHEYLNWFTETDDTFKKFKTDAEQKIASLEELYRQKLKLEAPATYWRERANKLRKEGQRWMAALIICIAVSVLILTGILNKVTDGDLEEVFKSTGSAIKWSVVLITTISFLAFAIRTFSKLTFSSFHLVRDAEEREQLAYVFLALQKEDSIDKTERHLIMQSLFSRADSGLLKDEGSPTMPGNILDKALSK